jgi:sugar/nucleoside kinase (ribokinase family)
MGKVGSDAFGQFIIDDLASQGLDTKGITRSKEVATSKTMIIPVISEDRRFIHSLGANADLSYVDIDLEAVAQGKILYVGGYLGLPRLDQKSLVSLLKYAKEKGLSTILDVIVPSGALSYGLGLHLTEALAYSDVFLPNDDEARALTGQSEPEKQAQAFLEQGCGTVVITMGEKGSLLKTKDLSLQADIFHMPIVDPSGAGDAFDAGFIAGMLWGWDLKRTLELASAVGASAVTKLGCTTGVFTAAEAQEFLKHNSLPITEYR